MSLTRHIFSVALGSKAQSRLSVGLFLGGAEVKVPDYKRQEIPRWNITDKEVSTQVTFGPYPQPVTFDRYVVFAGKEVLEEIHETDTVTLPRQLGAWIWNWGFTLAGGEKDEWDFPRG